MNAILEIEKVKPKVTPSVKVEIFSMTNVELTTKMANPD
jgi:hypothetical protein